MGNLYNCKDRFDCEIEALIPIFEAEIFAKKNRLTQTAMLYGCGNNIGNSAFATDIF